MGPAIVDRSASADHVRMAMKPTNVEAVLDMPWLGTAHTAQQVQVIHSVWPFV